MPQQQSILTSPPPSSKLSHGLRQQLHADPLPGQQQQLYSDALLQGLPQQQQQQQQQQRGPFASNGASGISSPGPMNGAVNGVTNNTNANTNSNTTNNNSAMLKNLSHVPCKFFRHGQCQAGTGCPFSHSISSIEPAPCKYFQKGNCKFGMKCALAHVLPDGRILNPRSLQTPGQQKQQQQQQQQPQQQQLRPGMGLPDPFQQQQQQNFYQPDLPHPISNVNVVASSGPTTSATIRNIYVSAASIYPGTPEYSQSLASTSSLSSSLQQPSSDFNQPTISSTLGENGPVIGSIPSMRHHKSASFVSPDYIHESQPPLVAPQPVSSSFTPVIPQSQIVNNNHSSFTSPTVFQQRSFSTTAYMNATSTPSSGLGTPPTSIWNKKVQPSASISSPLRPSAVSMLINSVSNIKIQDGASSSSPNVNGHYSALLHQSVIADDECAIEDGYGDGLEDFVPSSLSDLLTEQERRRRGSRPSSTNNPLLSSSPHLPYPLHNHNQYSTEAGSPSWTTSPRLFAQQQARRALEDDLTDTPSPLNGTGHHLRTSFSLSNSERLSGVNISNGNQPVSSSYLAPIGTPERGSATAGSYLHSYKSAVETQGVVGALPAIGTPVHGSLRPGRSPSGLVPPQAPGFGSAGKTQPNTSLFDDDINNSPEDEFDETQFAMDDEVVDKTSSTTTNSTSAMLMRS